MKKLITEERILNPLELVYFSYIGVSIVFLISDRHLTKKNKFTS